MHNTLLTTITIACAAIAAPWLCAQSNVTTTVHDYNGTTQLLMRSDDYNGSGFATYITESGNGSTGNNSKNSLISQINSNGAWKLDLYSQSVRTL